MCEDLFIFNVKLLIPLNHIHAAFYFLPSCHGVWGVCVCVCVHLAFNRRANINCHILILIYANLCLIQLFCVIKAVSFKLQLSSIFKRKKINLTF